MSINGCPAVNIEYANSFRSIVAVVCKTGAIQFIQDHCDSNIAVIQLFSCNTRLITPYQAVGIKGKVAIILNPVGISKNQSHLSICSQLIFKANYFICFRLYFHKCTNICSKVQFHTVRLCRLFRFCGFRGFGRFFRFCRLGRFSLIQNALNVIYITVSCCPTVNIEYAQCFRRIISVISNATTVQFIHHHCDTDITIIQFLSCNTSLIVIYQAISIKGKIAKILCPVGIAKDQCHRAFSGK